jgi:hypothetical protein
VLFLSLGILFASYSDSYESGDVNKYTPEIVFTSNTLKLLKYYEHNGTARCSRQYLDGIVLEENMSW